MDCKFFDSLREGDSANGIKLGMGLTCGDFWPRPDGCRNLYRGDGPFMIDIDSIITVCNIDSTTLAVPDIPGHDNGVRYYYLLRSADGCGHEENGLQSLLRVELDSNGDLVRFGDGPFDLAAVESEGTIRILWYYCPLDLPGKCVGFNIYSNNGAGAVNETLPVEYITSEGKGFYCYQSEVLSAGRYVFCVKAVFVDGSESKYKHQPSVEITDVEVTTTYLAGHAI